MQFSFWEVLIILTMAQSLYVVVHLVIIAKRKTQILIPTIFFTNIFVALVLSFSALRWGGSSPNLNFYEWAIWSTLPFVATLFIVQLTSINKRPALYLWLWPLFYFVFINIINFSTFSYANFPSLFSIITIVFGCLNILFLLIIEGSLTGLQKLKNGSARYWVTVSLLLVNTAFLSLVFLLLLSLILPSEFQIINIIIALAFTYLGSTSLFRIYPYPLDIKDQGKTAVLSSDELQIAKNIEELLYTQKVYQEQGYNRTSMALEVGLSEGKLGKIVKIYFKKSVPNLLNELRVNDAKVLLNDTEADITIIAYEAGFNSLATFNRVFKSLTGVSPSEYRIK